MNKQLVLPISASIVAFVAGGLLLSSYGVSASEQDGKPFRERASFRENIELTDEQIAHREQMQSIVADLLDVSVEELEEARENREMRELAEAAGYEERGDLREAVKAAAEEAGLELPERGEGHRHMHRH